MPQARSQREQAQAQELAYDVKFLLVVLLLFVFYPVGLVLMWVWMPWPTWVKLLISLPVLLGLLVFFFGMVVLVGLMHRGMNNRQMMPFHRSYRMYYQSLPQGTDGSPSESPTVTPLPSSAAY